MEVKDQEGAEKKKTGRSKKKVRCLFVLALLLFFICWIVSWIPVTERIELDLLPGDASDLRLVLLTDLHSCYYGPEQKWLLDRVDREKPDIILLGGDFFDDEIPDDNSRITAEALVKKYPCYYVTGNHEFWSGRAEEMKEYLRSIGVHVLAGDCESIRINDCSLDICGVDDPTDIGISEWTAQLDSAFSQTDPSHLRILLTHRPEKVGEYENYDFDLILAGHAHGGQFLIPGLNRGLLAPDQGFMAEYVNGTYELQNGSLLEVSRGLGRESTPLPRFFDHPEVVVLDIR